MAQLRFQPILFMRQFIRLSVRSMRIFGYVIGHILFLVSILSIIFQSEFIFRIIIDGSFFKIALITLPLVLLLGIGSGLIGAANNVFRTRMMVHRVSFAYQKINTRNK